MTYLDICRAQLPQDEGRKAFPYNDTEGIPTIGIGRNLQNGLSPDEINYLFANDLKKADASARGLYPDFDALSDNRRAVLVNMAFNLGSPRLAGFVKMRAAVLAGDFDRAADEMLSSRWATQVGQRAQRLAKMMREG